MMLLAFEIAIIFGGALPLLKLLGVFEPSLPPSYAYGIGGPSYLKHWSNVNSISLHVPCDVFLKIIGAYPPIIADVTLIINIDNKLLVDKERV